MGPVILISFTRCAGEPTNAQNAKGHGYLPSLCVLCASAVRDAILMAAGISLMSNAALQEEARDRGGKAGGVSQTLGKGGWQPGAHQRTQQRPLQRPACWCRLSSSSLYLQPKPEYFCFYEAGHAIIVSER